MNILYRRSIKYFFILILSVLRDKKAGFIARHQPYYELSYTSNFPFLPSGALSYAKYCTIEDGIENCNVGIYESETTTYYTADVSVSGNASSGYDVSYILTDSAGHSYTVTFTDLTPCDDGGISSGSGVVNFNGEEIRI